VLSFHGGLSSRLDAAPAHEAAVAAGVRLISPDRPGMGLSTYQRGRRLTDWPADVAHLNEALGIGEFAVMGWSAGGAYAAVCAAAMGDRVTAAALLSSAVPLDLYGTTRGLSMEDRVLLVLTRRTPRLASALMKVSIVNASNARLFRAVMRTFPPADRTVLTEWGPPDLALSFVREAMRQGTEGCVQDYRIFGAPWGFSLEDIHVPVDIWEGSDDNTGPPGYRSFLKRHIPQATIHVVPGEGHLSLLPHQAPAIFSSLLGGDHDAESTARWNVG
jgi:pimeloyl-ACP methyl ester carboxylesterase